MGFFRKTFEDRIESALVAFRANKFDAAVDFCIRAIEGDERGVEKFEDLAWKEVIEGEEYTPDLILYAEVLRLHQPTSCIGQVGAAKSALMRGAYNEFEPFIDNADGLADKLEDLSEAVEMSLGIYELLIRYWRAQEKEILIDSVAAVREKGRIMDRVHNYGRKVLDRIELAAARGCARPGLAAHYLAICRAWPLLRPRAPWAEQNLRS